MLLRRFYDDKLAQASYLIGCQVTGEAIVVDPHRDVEVFLQAARDERMQIRYVSETHIHADFLSGARELARRAGAELLLSGDGPPDWQYAFVEEDGARTVHEGDEIRLGNVRLQVFHTPGHTPEHISFEITDGASSQAPMGILTGDFIFVGDVGRPDLLEKAAGVQDTMEEGARVLYRSLQRFREMPGYLQVLPGHGAGSACGKALGAVPTSTLGYEHMVNWAFQTRSEGDFVAQVLQDQPEPPTYFATMKRLNRDGPAMLGPLPDPARLDPATLETVRAAGGILVDIRDAARFAAGHVPGSLNVPLNKEFPNWCGWFLPYDRDVHLIADGPGPAREAARDLALIGMDRTVGYFDRAALEAWGQGHGGPETSRVIDWADAEKEAEAGGLWVDVRKTTEWNEGHVPEARHIHLGYLSGRTDELPKDRTLLLYCRSGNRSGMAMALLQAAGFPNVVNVQGGVAERTRRGLPLEVPGA